MNDQIEKIQTTHKHGHPHQEGVGWLCRTPSLDPGKLHQWAPSRPLIYVPCGQDSRSVESKPKLAWWKKFVCIKKRTQLSVDSFLQDFADGWKDGNRPVIRRILCISGFVNRHYTSIFPDGWEGFGLNW